MSEGGAEQWETTGLLITPYQPPGAAPLYLARRQDDGAYALLKQMGREWEKHGPAVTLEDAFKIAEHVASGNPKIITWPLTQLSLATALLAVEHIARQAQPSETSSSPDHRRVTGGHPSVPSPDAETSRVPSKPAVDDAGPASRHVVSGQSEHAAPSSCSSCGG